MMVLGLVIQEPDTPAGVALRLSEQFPNAYFPPNSPHTNLPNMARDGFVRMIEKGPTPSLHRYEAARKGREHFRRWIRNSVGLPPTIRIALQGKLKFAELEDLPALLATVRMEEKAFTSASHAARACVLEEQEARRRARGPEDPRARMRSIQSQYESDLWIGMAQGLARLIEDLEKFLDELSGADQTG